MDTTHRTGICRIRCIIILFFVSTYKNLAEAVTLEFCQVTDHMTNNSRETGVIKSPGFGTSIRDPTRVPDLCTIYITVCPGCRLRLTNITTIDCTSAQRCFLRSASVELKGIPMTKIFFNDSTTLLNATSIGRSVSLVFRKSPNDAVTGQYGFYIYYRVMRPEPIEYSFDHNRMSGTISSPGFPNRYSSNGDIFTFQFEPSNVGHYLQLGFSDWCLSKYSKIMIEAGYTSTTYDYLSERPFVTTFQKPILITFETGIGDTAINYIGFKATYMYTSDPHENAKPTKVGNDVLDSAFGGKISFLYRGPGVVDYVWVIPRSDLIGSDKTQLKLRIDSTVDLPYGALKIRSGPTSENVGVNWTIGNSLFSESGFYLRIRTKVTFAFNAVFAWTEKADIWEPANCRTGFLCTSSLECLKSKDLACDGIKHCDDASDEIGCSAISKPCPSYWICRRTHQVFCITKRCDGTRDCLDSSDEINCPLSTMRPFATTTLDSYNPYANYNTLSIALPLVMLGIIIAVVVSFIICIALRRKRHMSAIRRTAHHEASPGAWNTDGNVNSSAHCIPNSEVVSPPPYSEVALNNNQGFATSPGLPAPPPYEKIAKPLAPVELSTLPPPYLPSDETASMQPPREHGRTSPRHSGEQRISGSTDPLINGDSQRSQC